MRTPGTVRSSLTLLICLALLVCLLGYAACELRDYNSDSMVAVKTLFRHFLAILHFVFAEYTCSNVAESLRHLFLLNRGRNSLIDLRDKLSSIPNCLLEKMGCLFLGFALFPWVQILPRKIRRQMGKSYEKNSRGILS